MWRKAWNIAKIPHAAQLASADLSNTKAHAQIIDCVLLGEIIQRTGNMLANRAGWC